MKKGTKHTEETKRLLSERNKGKRPSKETVARRAATLQETYKNPEVRQKCREAQVRIWSNPERMEKHLDKMKREWSDPEYREKQSISRSLAWTPERRKIHSETMKEVWSDCAYKERLTNSFKEAWATVVDRDKHRESMKASWLDPEKKEARLKKYFENWDKRPNKLEQVVIDICKEYELPFEYVGDGAAWFGGCNPDFIRNDSTKQIIEVFGDYWHKDDEPERMATFERFGYDTLIIWEHELLDELQETIKKIVDFSNG